MMAEGRIPPSPYELGVSALDEGRFGDALHAFEQAYHLNPHDPALHEAIGRLYYEQANYRRAREYLQYALHLAPRSTGPWLRLALVEQREGHSDQAIMLLRRVLEIDPEHAEAARLLEEERARARIARRLPLWQPARPWRAPVVLRPPRQVGPDGRDRPATLRAPHPCANCYFRAGRERRAMHAVRYHWWNLGLVGMLFGGWIVYVLWTYFTRERRFRFDPLLCPTCGSNRRILRVAFWLLAAFAPLFGLATLIAAGNVGSLLSVGIGWALPAVTGAVFAACVAGAVVAHIKEAGQRGVRLDVGSEEDVVFRFAGAEYEAAFLELNGAFRVDQPRPGDRDEAQSFLPVAESELGEQPAPAPEELPSETPDAG